LQVDWLIGDKPGSGRVQMKYRIAPLALGLALAIAGVSLPAQAQDETSSVAVRASDHDARAVLVRRYFEVIQFNKLMNGMMDAMLGSVLVDESIPEDKRGLVREAATDAFAIVLPQMVQANIDLYAEAFTLDELEQLVAFYESPVGRSIMTKTVMLTRESGEMITRFTPIMEAEMMRQLCVRMDCSASQGTANPAKRP
jgi:hypothetical protein